VPLKVLVADDDAASRAVVRAVVGRDGHAVCLAEDGEEAWRQYLEEAPDVVVSDRRMPGCDGLELCRRIRDHESDRYTYVILVTGMEAEEDVLAGLDAGADDYLPKPVEPFALRARLRVAERVTHLHRDLAESRRQLDVLSRTDSLTGLFNRRHMHEVLARHASAAVRQGHDLSVAVADIDRFKNINDSLGHPAGDQVLVALADTLRRSIRAEDVVGRLGGEEFLLVLPYTNLADAARVAERIRSAVETTPVAVGGSEVQFTVSIGCATGVSDGVLQLLDRADAALYEAKSAGRNRVVVDGTDAEAEG
jgi:diguanylate cyclase (GGDEF)-like protein